MEDTYVTVAFDLHPVGECRTAGDALHVALDHADRVGWKEGAVGASTAVNPQSVGQGCCREGSE